MTTVGKEVDWIQRAERIIMAKTILSSESQANHQPSNGWTRLRRRVITRSCFNREFLRPELEHWFKVNVARRGQT